MLNKLAPDLSNNFLFRGFQYSKVKFNERIRLNINQMFIKWAWLFIAGAAITKLKAVDALFSGKLTVSYTVAIEIVISSSIAHCYCWSTFK